MPQTKAIAVSKKCIQVQLDRQLAEQAEQIFEAIGLNTTTALTIFYKQVIKEGGIPFKLAASEREQAEARLAAAISSLPVQKMSKKDMAAWLEEDEY